VQQQQQLLLLLLAAAAAATAAVAAAAILPPCATTLLHCARASVAAGGTRPSFETLPLNAIVYSICSALVQSSARDLSYVTAVWSRSRFTLFHLLMLRISKPSGLQSLPPLVAAASSDDLRAIQVCFPLIFSRWVSLSMTCSAWLLVTTLTSTAAAAGAAFNSFGTVVTRCMTSPAAVVGVRSISHPAMATSR